MSKLEAQYTKFMQGAQPYQPLWLAYALTALGFIWKVVRVYGLINILLYYRLICL